MENQRPKVSWSCSVSQRCGVKSFALTFYTVRAILQANRCCICVLISSRFHLQCFQGNSCPRNDVGVFFPASLTRLMWPSSSTDLYRTRWLGCAPDGVQFKCSQITVVFEPVQLQRPSVDTEPWRTLGKEKELTKIKHQKFCAVSVYTARYT